MTPVREVDMIPRIMGRHEQPPHRKERVSMTVPGQGRVNGVLAVLGCPPEVSGPHGLTRASYSDRFTLSTPVVASPEHWARAMFGDVPDTQLRVIFGGLCRYRLIEGRAADRIGGCLVVGRGEHHVAIEMRGPLMAGLLVVSTGIGWVTLSTQVCYRTGRGQVMWTQLSKVHRRLAPGLLLGAEQELARARAARPS